MARIFTEGFEMGDNLFFDTAAGDVSIFTTSPRSGTYYAGIGVNSAYALKNFTAVSELYLRLAWLKSATATTDSTIVRWRAGTTELGSLRWTNATTKFQIYTGTGTLVGTSTRNWVQGNWYLLEVHVKISDSVGAIDLKIDGVADVSFSGDTKPGADTTVNNLSYMGVGGGGTIYNFFDDLALNDTTGAADNSWCGDGKVIALFPNANGDFSQLMGSDSNQTDNYLLVDEKPHDTDTTYVVGSGIGDKDLYNLAATGLTNVTISRVWAESRSRDTVAAGSTINLGILPNGGSEVWSSGISLLTTYAVCLGTVHTVNPATSSAWTTATLDSLQAGVKIGS